MATVTFLEPGTDATQDLTFFTNGNGTFGTGAITSATDQFHTGSRSLKSVSATAGDEAIATSPNGMLADAGCAASFWMRLSGVAPSVDTMLCEINDLNNTNDQIGIGITTLGKLCVQGNGTTKVNGTTALVANTWMRISFGALVTSASNWSLLIYLNGVLELTIGNAQGTLNFTGISCLAFGIDHAAAVGFTSSSILTVWFDDIYADNRTDKSDPGAILVTAKRPFSNGTSNAFTTQIGAGGSGYGSGHAPQVNEQPLNTANGWSLSTTTKATEEYTIEGLSVGDVDLTGHVLVGVRGWISADNASAADSPVSHIIVDGTATAFTSTQAPAIYTQNSATPTVYPAGTGTDIGMDGQYTTNAHLWSLFEAGILVAYRRNKTVLATQLQSPLLVKQANALRVLTQRMVALGTPAKVKVQIGIAVQAVTAALSRQAQAIRLLAQPQVAAIVRRVTAIRIATQAQATIATKQVALTRVATQAVVALESAAKVLLRTIVATQAEIALLVKQAQAIRIAAQAQVAPAMLLINKTVSQTILATQAQVTIAVKAVLAIRLVAQAISVIGTPVKNAGGAFVRTIVATQAEVLSLVKQVQAVRIIGQGQSAGVVKQAQAVRVAMLGQLATSLKTVLATRVVTQTVSVATSALRVLLRAIGATQAVRATTGRQVQLVRVAAQASGVLIVRQVNATRLALQASSASIGKLIGKLLATVQAALATAFGVNPGVARPRSFSVRVSADTALCLTVSE
jgi:hypothetical protein